MGNTCMSSADTFPDAQIPPRLTLQDQKLKNKIRKIKRKIYNLQHHDPIPPFPDIPLLKFKKTNYLPDKIDKKKFNPADTNLYTLRIDGYEYRFIYLYKSYGSTGEYADWRMFVELKNQYNSASTYWRWRTITSQNAAQYNGAWSKWFLPKRDPVSKNISKVWEIVKDVRIKLAKHPMPPNLVRKYHPDRLETKLEPLRKELKEAIAELDEITSAIKEINYGSKFGQYPLIQDNMRMLQESGISLQSRLLLKGKHPMMALFETGRCPKYQDDTFIRIDLVYSVDEKTNTKKNVVRFESKTYGSFSDPNVFKWSGNVYDISKAVILIRRWCVQYQEKNTMYTFTSNNCRKFMIKLCAFLGIPCDETGHFEEFWYKGREWTEQTKQQQTDITDCIIM